MSTNIKGDKLTARKIVLIMSSLRGNCACFFFFRFRSNLFNFVTLSTDESVSKLHYADVFKFHFEYRFVYLTTGDNFYPSELCPHGNFPWGKPLFITRQLLFFLLKFTFSSAKFITCVINC